MNNKFKNRHGDDLPISELPLSFGGIFAVEIKGGFNAYVIPQTQLKNLTAKDLAKIKQDIQAREILEKAKKQAIIHKAQGWTREDFKRDFLKVHQRISKFLSQKKYGTKSA